MEPDLTKEESERITASRNRRLCRERRRNSLLPLQWKMAHSSRWMAQVVASEFSLVAFLLLLLMVFSKKWLCPSKSRFHQRYPQNVTKRVYTSIHSMSTGLLYICISKSCPSSDNGEGLGFVLTTWLHLPYLPCLQRMPFFGLIGIILSFCEVTLIFLTLLLFPVNLWIYELRKNISVPIGWSYFIGWLVLILYFTCGILCYLNHKNFWSLIMSSSSINTTWSSSEPESLRSDSQTSNRQENILEPTEDAQKPLSPDKAVLPPQPDTTG
ncbi:outer dense fiber protein 4 isoform X3 [Mastomys coucha]|uniref:outer dense fiber protein 4 isoform X3 n=1 Tax=Mastomys coucha TaxID=35658 RepID=UPI0012623097|nr:outer dense fiber protein 4 isoform X3 [Mastomys coucha]